MNTVQKLRFPISFSSARRHKLVSFEGETLFQRRDDDVPITLLYPVSEIRERMAKEAKEVEDFTWGKCM